MIKFCNVHIPDLNRLPELLKISEAEQMSNFGPLYRSLCRRLHSFLNLSPDKEVVITSSGHVALMASYIAMGCKTLLIPAYTFESTRLAATLQGLRTIIVNVNLQGCIDLHTLNSIVGDYDTVVAVCPLSTIPNLNEITEFCKYNNKKLIIDGAATFGTPGIYNFGDAFCLSFHATKTFPLGEGGAVICDKEIAKKIRSYIMFGFDHSRDPIMPGLNGKVSEYTAAIGHLLLDEISEDLAIRKRNYQLYLKYGLSEFMPISWTGNETVYQSLPLYLPIDQVSDTRNHLALAKVDWKQYYKPLDNNHTSNFLYRQNVCVPLHPDVTAENIKQIAGIVNKYAR